MIYNSRTPIVSKIVFLLSIPVFKVSGNKYCRQKVSGSINVKLFTIFLTITRIGSQTVSEYKFVGTWELAVGLS